MMKSHEESREQQSKSERVEDFQEETFTEEQ
jgi:hypothetical protein